MGALTLVTGPVGYPVTLQEAKNHLKLFDINDFDAEVNTLIKEGTDYAERYTGQKLITQTWTYKLDDFETAIKMPRSPLQSVSSIQYQDDDNATQTLASTEYTVDTDSMPGRIYQANTKTYPTTWPDLNTVTITFVCGYGAAAAVPERFKRIIKLYIQSMWEMNEKAGDIADNLIAQNKVSWLALNN